VPLSPTKRIGRRGARDFSIALGEEEREKRGEVRMSEGEREKGKREKREIKKDEGGREGE
jgi:hypothetical protein